MVRRTKSPAEPRNILRLVTLFYAAMQHFCAFFPIIDSMDAASVDCTLRPRTLLRAAPDSLPITAQMNLIHQLASAMSMTRKIEGTSEADRIGDRMWCLGADSNHRHADFQSAALPTELPRPGSRRVRNEGVRRGGASIRKGGWPVQRLSSAFIVHRRHRFRAPVFCISGDDVAAGQPALKVQIRAPPGAERTIGWLCGAPTHDARRRRLWVPSHRRPRSHVSRTSVASAISWKRAPILPCSSRTA